MKIRPAGAKSFHADGQRGRKTGGKSDGWTDTQTDMTELTVAFRNFPKAPKNYLKEILHFVDRASLYNLVNKDIFLF